MKLMLQIAGGVFLGTISAALVMWVTASIIARYQIEIGMQQATQEIKNMESSTLTKPAPATEKVWIPGQSIKTCLHGHHTLNETVLKCREGHYETVHK